MKEKYLWLGFILLIFFIQMSCVSVPHLVLPQKDIESFNLNEPTLNKKVLVASRSSEFKDAVVANIKSSYQDQPIFIRFIGIDQLKNESAANYQAVVLINTCWSWDMDRNVKSFIKRSKNQTQLIVLTTSGSGNWQPKKKGQNFDAVSAASQINNVEAMAASIIKKIDNLLGTAN